MKIIRENSRQHISKYGTYLLVQLLLVFSIHWNAPRFNNLYSNLRANKHIYILFLFNDHKLKHVFTVYVECRQILFNYRNFFRVHNCWNFNNESKDLQGKSFNYKKFDFWQWNCTVFVVISGFSSRFNPIEETPTQSYHQHYHHLPDVHPPMGRPLAPPFNRNFHNFPCKPNIQHISQINNTMNCTT